MCHRFDFIIVAHVPDWFAIAATHGRQTTTAGRITTKRAGLSSAASCAAITDWIAIVAASCAAAGTTSCAAAAIAAGTGVAAATDTHRGRRVIRAILQRFFVQLVVASAQLLLLLLQLLLLLHAANARRAACQTMTCRVHTQLANAIRNRFTCDAIQIFHILTHITAARRFAATELHLLH